MNAENIRALAARIRNAGQGCMAYNQRTWFRPADPGVCGTAACLAGHAAELAGWKLVAGYGDEPEAEKGGRLRQIEEVAAEWLGVDELSPLFDLDPGDCESNPWPAAYSNRWADRKNTGEREEDIAADLLEALADGREFL